MAVETHISMSQAGRKKTTHTAVAIENNHMQLLNVPLEGALYLKYKTTDPDPHAEMLVGTVHTFLFTDAFHAAFHC